MSMVCVFHGTKQRWLKLWDRFSLQNVHEIEEESEDLTLKKFLQLLLFLDPYFKVVSGKKLGYILNLQL